MSVIEGPLVFVDIETNGMSHSRGRVIEVAAIRCDKGFNPSRMFSAVIDPQTEIPPFITNLTGITADQIAGAPTFDDIAGELFEILDGAVFIAHNVRFDYAFLKQEFKRAGKNFNPRMLCTVKLSQALFPEYKSHKLSAVIDRCHILVQKRHRAYDDAYALTQFLRHVHDKFPKDVISDAVKLQLRKPALPKGLPASSVESLPETPGVYILQDDSGSPLYVGKSLNIKKRVLSHFSRDHSAVSEFKISQSVSNIEALTTDGELQALLLESKLIKQLQPLYNRRLRRHQKLTIARQTTDKGGYINVSLENIASPDPSDVSDILGIYTTKGRAKRYLEQAIKDHLLCPKLMGFEKSKGSCFLYQLGKCGGACSGDEPAGRYNARLLHYFNEKRIESWPFKSAIMISEKNPAVGAESQAIVVDQWCVIADIVHDEGCQPQVKIYNRSFDIDTYKILRSYLRDKMHRLTIKPISKDQLLLLDSY